jgi:hypothetical protein
MAGRRIRMHPRKVKRKQRTRVIAGKVIRPDHQRL